MSALLPDAHEPADERQHEYVVVARRYRPQSFEQLVGQQQVSQALGNAIQTNRVGHAYLFTGARGVGKTSTARIFSKCLNCVNGPTTTPCGECDICRGIASGEDMDVIEIDGASNRGIDEIRQLRANVNGRPSRARFKVFIIDEVHMLTTPAFNALLKTLEEPPEHVKFIFCTTEADKIPITVLSRCQRFDFSPIEAKSIVDRLAMICRNEQVEAEPEALQLLARRANGSMRDSQSLLEQLLSFGGKKLTVDDIHSLLGTAKGSRLFTLIEHLAQRNAAAALGELDAAVHEGVDVGQLIEQLVGLFRDIMAAHVGCGPDLWLNSSPGDGAKLAELGRVFGLETTLAIVQILDQALVRMRQSTHTRTLAEIAIVRISKLEDLDALPHYIAELRGGVPVGSVPARRPTPPPPPAPEKKTAELGPDPVPPPPQAEIGTPSSVPPPHIPAVPAAELPPLSDAEVFAAWRQAAEELADMQAGLVERVTFQLPNRIGAAFRAEHGWNKQSCERPERRTRMMQALGRILGRPVVIDYELLPAETRPQASSAAAPVRPNENKRQRARAMEKHPLVKQAIELFDAEVLQVIEPKEADEQGQESGNQAG